MSLINRGSLVLVTVLSGWLLVMLMSGCEEVEQLVNFAQQQGAVDADQADSINRSAAALEKSWQDLTPEQEYYIGRAVAAQIFQSYTPLDEVAANTYLNLLGQSLAIFSERPETFGGYQFVLLDSDEINAFAAPGGLILVSRGMVSCCQTEDELAAVLAHEICHVELQHGLRAIKQGRLTEALTIVSAESAKTLGDEDLAAVTREFEGSVGDVVMTLTTSGYSRTQERDADAAAVRLLRCAGYPEGAMITLLNLMDQRLATAGGLGFAKTHPSARSRAAALVGTVVASAQATDPARQARFSTAMKPIGVIQ